VDGPAFRRAADVFEASSGGGPTLPAIDVKSLHAKIGELTLENHFLEGALSKAGLLSAKPDSHLS
jgi:transposase